MFKDFLRFVFIVFCTASLSSWLLLTFCFKGFDRVEKALDDSIRSIEIQTQQIQADTQEMKKKASRE